MSRKYLATATNTKDVSPFLAEEAKRAAELRALGIITHVWVKADFSGAFVVLECTDEDAATSALNSLPLVINDATTFVLTEIVDVDSTQPGAA